MRYNLRHLLLTIATAALVALGALTVAAQNPTGSIRGTVTDEQGAVIPKAAITVTNKATGDVRKTTSTEDGTYGVENLLPGDYDVKVEAGGFSTITQTVTVQVGNTSNGNATLRVGAANVVVDVISEAPIIDKTDYKIDGVVNREKIDALPLNGRNFLQLALLEPGVSVSAKNPGSQNNLFNVSIGGADSALTRLTVDGGSILDPVCGGAAQNFSTETIQEFQISTFNFDLSTGVTSVGSINIVSRTGTNQFHGNGFLFFRDHSIAAFPDLVRVPGQSSPFFRRYQYGGSFGGPIKKDRAWFFGNVERLDQNAAIGTAINFPALASLDNITSSPYKGYLLNVRADMKVNEKNNLFGRYSRDDNSVFGPTGNNTLPSNWRDNASTDDNLQGGLTSVLTNRLVNDARFNFQHIVNGESIPTSAECPPSNPGCIGLGGPQIQIHSTNFTIGNNPNAFQARDLKRYQTTDNLSWQKGSHRIKFGGEWEHNYGFGHWAFASPTAMLLFNPNEVLATNAFISTLPLPAPVKAALNIPLPADFTTPGAQITYNDILKLPFIGSETGIGDPAQPPPFNTNIARQSNRYRVYAQDSWLVRPGFTLSYGTSWSYETNLQNHDLTKPSLLAPLIGKLGKPGKELHEVGPSAGFAWDVANKGKTVIRGGAGIYYDTVLFVTRLQERATIGPAGNGRSLLPSIYFQNPGVPGITPIPGLPFPLNQINPPVGAGLLFTSIPTKFTAGDFLGVLNAESPLLLSGLQAAGKAGFTGIDFFKTGTGVLDPNLQVPYSLQYSIGVQHQLRNNLAVSADFVLRKGVHELFQSDYNLFNRAAALGGPVIPKCVGAAAINPAAQCSNGAITVTQSGGRSEYKALLVKVDKRFSNRYQFTASYALSSLTGFFTSENETNWFGNHGYLGGDARHRFTLSAVVDLPKGFQASLIAVVVSAPPFDARLPSTIDLFGDGSSIAGNGGDTLPGLQVNSLGRGTSKKDLFNLVTAFNQNFAGKKDAQGATIPALILPEHFSFGSPFQSEDIRLTKTFKIKESYSVQAFIEIFNIFNVANLGGYSETLDTVNPNPAAQTFSFGQPTTRAGQSFGTGGPRALQFGGRFTF
jgi:hypothetical protein